MESVQRKMTSPILKDRVNVDIVVVIYNKEINAVPVIQLYANRDDVRYCVCDNSTNENVKHANAQDSKSYSNLTYIDMMGNKGLSRAYNSALNYCTGDIICVFDDDTTAELTYASQVKAQYEGEGVYLPLVKSGGRLLSPLKKLGPVISKCRNVGKLNLKTCSAFNSGMAISSRTAKAIAYDERIFLDFVDHAFCREAHKRGVPFYLLHDVEVQQNYSKETNDLQAALKRSAISSRDIAEYYSGSFLDRAYGGLYLVYKLVVNTLRYRSLAFLKQALTAHP